MSSFVRDLATALQNKEEIEINGPNAIFVKQRLSLRDSDDEDESAVDVGEEAGEEKHNDTIPKHLEWIEDEDLHGIESMIEMLRHVAIGDKYLEDWQLQLEEAVEANYDLFDDGVLKVLQSKIQSKTQVGYQEILDKFRFVSKKKMEKAGELLRALLTLSKGDAKVLQQLALSYARKGQLDLAFINVLEANIEACEAAGLKVKHRVLIFLRDEVILKELKRLPNSHDRDDVIDDLSHLESAEEKEYEAFQRHHAPAFIGGNNDIQACGTLVANAPKAFRDCSGYSDLLLGKKRSNTQKRISKQLSAEFSKGIADDLMRDSFAVLDNFIGIGKVRCVRAEMGILDIFYKQSEIWVGKEAGLGAQIHMPDVRGDKVLWMCGGHSRAAGVVDTREVTMRGHIEPCDLRIKRKTHKVRFSAIKEIVKAIDALVMGELKVRVPRLSRVVERSDAMLACYPGGGSRFQKHIDNTAEDGRVLTVVLYLNPNWEECHGGAIRVFPPGHNRPTDIMPEASRICIFYSDVIPHEVLPCHAHRHALTLWYYDEDKRLDAVKNAAKLGVKIDSNVEGLKHQKDAKQFMLSIITVGRSGKDHDMVVSSLCTKADRLSKESMKIVSSIVGAPDPEEFKRALRQISSEDLLELRKSLETMGIH